MPAPLLYRLLTYLIALVWLANGLLCKVLNLVPRHAAIVARILGPAHSGPLTRLIGLAEIGMAIWLLSGIKRRWCVLAQMGLVVTGTDCHLVKPLIGAGTNPLLVTGGLWR